MWRWGLILAAAGLLALGAVVYLLVCFHRTTPVKRLGERHRLLAWLAAALPLGLTACIVRFNVYTLVVAVLHLVLILLLCGAVARLVGRLRGRAVSHDLRVAAAVLLTAVYLGVGAYGAWNVAQTNYVLTTDKALPEGGLRIVALADTHLGVTLDGTRFAALMERVQAVQPDAVVIVGDFVDDDSSAEDMIAACQALGGLETTYGVFFAYGNHDNGYFNQRDFTGDQLRTALEENGVVILADEAVPLGEGACLIGRRDRSMQGRLDAAALMAGVAPSRYAILLDHQPIDYAAEAAAQADLVLSGHTHGGHIFPLGQLAELFGIDDSRYGHKRIGNTDFIVTSGASGWAIPIKTGTRSEFVVVEIGN